MNYIIVAIKGNYKGLTKENYNKNEETFTLYFLMIDQGEAIYKIKIKEADIIPIKQNIQDNAYIVARCFLNSRNGFLSLSFIELIAGYHYERTRN